VESSKPKTKILVVVGPTASGKSALAVILAKKFGGEIISADSRQIYKGLNIGTGKIRKEEMQGVLHHMISVASPKKQYNAARYQKEAQRAVIRIIRKNKLPIVCGGTGFYIDILLNKIPLTNVPPNNKLRKTLENKPPEELFKILKKLDAKRAEKIDKNNPRRLIRAIEIAKSIGKVPAITKEVDKYDVLFIGLCLKPDILNKKIKSRLSKRIRQGMVAESEKLHKFGLSWKKMDALGLEYRFVSKFLQGKITKEEMRTKLEIEIRKYAKRQMTWFRKNKSIRWFDISKKEELERLEKEVLSYLRL